MKNTFKGRVRAHFSQALAYDEHAHVQQASARRLVEHLSERCRYFEMGEELSVLEIGCGTGFLTRLILEYFPQCKILATDISPVMIEKARRRCTSFSDRVQFLVMDVDYVSVQSRFDIICSNFALQWVTHPKITLKKIAHLLRPGGLLVTATLAAGSFKEWATACTQAGIECGTPDYPSSAVWQSFLPVYGHGQWIDTPVVVPVANGLEFLRGLKAIGASTPHPGYKIVSGRTLKKAIALFDKNFRAVTYHVAMGWYREPPVQGMFVTGTDTNIGKTFISSLLAESWGGSYWKPIQTGLAEEEGDASVVQISLGDRNVEILPSLWALQEPLSPKAALVHELVRPPALQVKDLTLLQSIAQPVVVEGAGGVCVPVDEGVDMIDIILKIGLPVIVVARSGLGTINHTLLTLLALQGRGVSIAGIILNGPMAPHNRATIEEEGKIPVIAEIPWQENPHEDNRGHLRDKVPSFRFLWEG